MTTIAAFICAFGLAAFIKISDQDGLYRRTSSEYLSCGTGQLVGEKNRDYTTTDSGNKKDPGIPAGDCPDDKNNGNTCAHNTTGALCRSENKKRKHC